jgi:hypothetical protein
MLGSHVFAKGSKDEGTILRFEHIPNNASSYMWLLSIYEVIYMTQVVSQSILPDRLTPKEAEVTPHVLLRISLSNIGHSLCDANVSTRKIS